MTPFTDIILNMSRNTYKSSHILYFLFSLPMWSVVIGLRCNHKLYTFKIWRTFRDDIRGISMKCWYQRSISMKILIPPRYNYENGDTTYTQLNPLTVGFFLSYLFYTTPWSSCWYLTVLHNQQLQICPCINLKLLCI